MRKEEGEARKDEWEGEGRGSGAWISSEAVGEMSLHGLFLPSFPSWEDLGQLLKILGQYQH